MKKIKVSVAMATYNGEKYLKEQIRSILNNLGDNDELIISDDGSSDNTIAIINEFQDQRIRLIEGPRNGLKANFANAISNTTGDFIFLSDQDDVWFDNKVSIVLNEFLKDDNLLLIQHDAIVVDENDNTLYDSFSNHRKVKTGIIKNLIKNSYHGCCIAFKKELIKEILPIPNSIYLHDQWIGMIAEDNGKTKFINDKLMKYRRHSNNNSSFHHLSISKMIINRFMYLREYLKYKMR